ncbi:unnamed protein product [Paramecium pentaurelia]|uniref:Uncharacterized protein n=1 Tax=Paramecium pentaurelia TaxID=43138 RepID=A0A8S1VSQ8_9CILI|nr:unnamed protein product [Paramecium pentaurelia]
MNQKISQSMFNIIKIYPSKHYSHLILTIQQFTKINLHRLAFHQEKTHIYIYFKNQSFIINQTNNFEQTAYLWLQEDADNFQVYYNSQVYSQCDQIVTNGYDINYIGKINTIEYLG